MYPASLARWLNPQRQANKNSLDLVRTLQAGIAAKRYAGTVATGDFNLKPFRGDLVLVDLALAEVAEEFLAHDLLSAASPR